MKLETFLQFINAHDTVIIQSLIACILLTGVFYLAGRLLSNDSSDALNGGKNVSSLSPAMTSEIEKSLQKILENQTGVSAPRASAGGVTAGSTTGGGSEASTAEVNALRTELQTREQKVHELEQQVQQAQAESAKLAAANSGPSNDEKLKELETRLAEYEIISEDIADLSFYKEENARLQNEIAKLKTGGAGVAPAAAQAVPVTPPPIAAAPAPAAPQAPVVEAAVAKAAAPSAPAEAVAAPAGGGNDIDDDLMKEFAAAVAEQKDAKDKPPEAPAAPGESELLGKFEEFVKKT